MAVNVVEAQWRNVNVARLPPSGWMLFVMSPHADHFNCLDIFDDLINQSVLNIDPTGICTRQVAYKFFVWWGIFEWIFFDDFQ